ncbi:hypothetical protein BJX61DRAFT_512841 [Aspergillus egyptiacus]|nr:hypothetical protein BJX61DRAFT_512841 [Aspergillus egyptiacus]
MYPLSDGNRKTGRRQPPWRYFPRRDRCPANTNVKAARRQHYRRLCWQRLLVRLSCKRLSQDGLVYRLKTQHCGVGGRTKAK